MLSVEKIDIGYFWDTNPVDKSTSLYYSIDALKWKIQPTDEDSIVNFHSFPLPPSSLINIVLTDHEKTLILIKKCYEYPIHNRPTPDLNTSIAWSKDLWLSFYFILFLKKIKKQYYIMPDYTIIRLFNFFLISWINVLNLCKKNVFKCLPN